MVRSWIFRPELRAATEPVATPVEGKVKRGPSIVEDVEVRDECKPLQLPDASSPFERERLVWQYI
jgi:hypothetical protein